MRTYEDANQWKWLRRGAMLALLAVGWAIIVATNKHVTAPVVFICLAYLAAVVTIFMLFQTGASAAMPRIEDDSVLAWGAPIGPRGELEREKRMLVKAIKEAEFDRDMGKLSLVDADQMINVYRARAIEIIKQLDAGGAGATTREQIDREVRARIAIDEAPAKKPKGAAVAKASRPTKSAQSTQPAKLGKGGGGKGADGKQAAAERDLDDGKPRKVAADEETAS